MSSQHKRGSLFYTLLGYLLILVFLLAIALIIGAILYRFVFVPGRIPSEEPFEKWGGLTVFYAFEFLVGDQGVPAALAQQSILVVDGRVTVCSHCWFLDGF